MNNKDFDQFFAGKLQNDLDLDFRENDWNEVEGRLDAAKATPINWTKWLIPLIWLSLLGGIGCLIYKLDKTNDSLQDLRNEMVAQNQNPQIQTVIKEVVSTRVDTVFLTRTIFKNNTHDISVNGAGGLGTSTFSPFFLFDAERSTLDAGRIDFLEKWGANLEEKLADNFDFLKKEAFQNTDNQSLDNISVLNNLERTTISALPISSKELQPFSHSTADLDLNNETSWKYFFTPIDVEFGVSAGKSFIPTNELSSISSHNFGFKGEVQLPRNVSLVAGFDWYKLRYLASDKMNLGGDIPLPTGEELDDLEIDDLVFMRTNQSFNQVKLGLKYDFNNQSKITPYLGMNLLSSFNFKKNFYYFFDNPTIPNDEAELNLARNNTGFKMDGFGLDFGVEIELQNNLGLQFEGYYHFINQNSVSQYYDLTGLRASLLYHFNK